MTRARAGAAAWLLAMTGAAQAAGGHHAVDDAAILEPGTCELENWFIGARGGERAAHAGLGCRLGPVELGAAIERARDPAGHSRGYALQVKWAGEIADRLSAGLSLAPAWQAHALPRYQGSTVAGLLTWTARDDLAFHANLGRDLLRGAPDQARSGMAVEWSPSAGWSLVAERYVESATHFLRAGTRWSPAEGLTLDLSRARRLHGAASSSWTLGATWLIDRR